LKRFREQPHNRARGGEGESEAIRWLESHGYRIVARNVNTKAGEIDVVAQDGDTLCFVEIKARSSNAFGPAIAAVDARKQRRISRSAMLYLTRHPTDSPCRFDVVGLDLGENGWEVTLVKDAFRLA
jgi:putative endonuclease